MLIQMILDLKKEEITLATMNTEQRATRTIAAGECTAVVLVQLAGSEQH
jgi:hypothetical protein